MSNQRKRVVWDPLSTKKFDAVTKAEAAFTAITAVDGLISDDEARRAAAKDAQAASDDENLGYDSDSSSSSASSTCLPPCFATVCALQRFAVQLSQLPPRRKRTRDRGYAKK